MPLFWQSQHNMLLWLFETHKPLALNELKYCFSIKKKHTFSPNEFKSFNEFDDDFLFTSFCSGPRGCWVCRSCSCFKDLDPSDRRRDASAAGLMVLLHRWAKRRSGDTRWSPPFRTEWPPRLWTQKSSIQDQPVHLLSHHDASSIQNFISYKIWPRNKLWCNIILLIKRRN